MAMTLSLKHSLLLALVAFFIVSGICLLVTHSAIFMAIFKSNLVLGPNSASFPMWQKLPEPLSARMFLFHVLNPDEVSQGQKPKLEQVGPYVFQEQHEKTSIVWNHENGTVTYKQIRTWVFQPHLSNGTLEDQVTILNPVAASLGPMIKKNVPAFWLPGLNGVLIAFKEKLFFTASVKEILFDGFKDPLLDDLEGLVERLPFIKKFIPPGITDKFAFFYQRNGTDFTDGVWNMFTGESDVAKMGQVYSWNFSTQGVFPDQCGHVHGSAGEFYTPHLEKTHIDLFSNDLCRSIRLPFKSEVDIEGIKSYEFVADKSFFANGTENPLNSCYEPVGEQLRSGVYNTSLCRYGAPVFISQPHFLNADPYYLSLVQSGLSPDPTLHGTSFKVEPLSGIPTEVVARFQMNVLLAPVSGITMLKDVPTVYFPVMWFENKAGVPKNLVFQLSLLAKLPTILQGMGWVEVGLAVSILIIAGLCFMSRSTSVVEDRSPILNESLVGESGDENVFVGPEEDEDESSEEEKEEEEGLEKIEEK